MDQSLEMAGEQEDLMSVLRTTDLWSVLWTKPLNDVAGR